jgi:hypothetical protein
MAEFNYIEYLRNNPLLNPEGKQSLTENQRPGYHPDGTPKSDAEMSDDEREEFYLDLDDINEKKSSTKMKVSELKAKIKEDIIATLAEQEEDYEQASREIEYGISPENGDLESELMAQLDEAKEDDEEEEEEDVEIDDEVEVEDEIDMEPTESPSAGLTPEEQEIQNSLKIAYDNATAMGDEKLANQIGNSITFFTRTHVVER